MDDCKGYTLIEVMMSLTVLAIGAAGIFSLQAVAVTGNRDANDLTAATNIARAWVETIKTDAQQWNSFGPVPASDLAEAPMVNGLVGAIDTWVDLEAPPYSAGASAAQRTDGAKAANGKFCAQARVQAPNAPVAGGAVPPINGFELGVRVFWMKAEGAAPNCAAVPDPDDLGTYHWVYVTTLIVPSTLN